MAMPGKDGRLVVIKPMEALRADLLSRQKLPCGRCIGCRLERSRQWAVRLMHEAQMHEETAFVTLTYSDESLPESGSLEVRDLQLFFKRLRQKVQPKKLRYFAVGEYTDDKMRPHYHACVFGERFSDRRFFKMSKGLPVFTSDLLSEAWQNKGHVAIGNLTFESASYVAKYVTKKITGEKAEGHYGGRKPEFSVMSRRPGIGRDWYEKYGEQVARHDTVMVRGHEAKPPRYYDELLRRKDPDRFEEVKESRRKVAESKSDGDHPDRLRASARVAEARLKLKGERNV